MLRRGYGFQYERYNKSCFLQSPFPNNLNREYIKADDNAVLNLDWLIDEEKTNDDSPVLLVLPGVTGHSRSSYLIHIIEKSYRMGWKVVVLVYPGTDYSKIYVCRLGLAFSPLS